VATGSGGNLVVDFLNSEAEAFISGDLRYHGVREIEYARRGAIDIGHFHSEHLMAEALTQRLQRAFERRRVEVRVQACLLERDPFTVL
jgi:putative NIF3 family GTP cyclohydrolase 1 type 2